MEVGVCRIVFGDLRSRLGKFINLEPGVKNPKSRSENVKLENMKPELEAFYKKCRVSLCPIRSQIYTSTE